jgi:hypothetical protein
MWARKLIHLLWRFNHSIWDTHNADRHEHTLLQDETIRRDRLQAYVHTLYNSSPLMLAADRDIFYLPVEDQLTAHHATRIELWISRDKPIMAIIICDASTAIKHTFQSIASFFTPTSHRTLEADEAHPPDSDPTLASHSTHTIPTRQLCP